ncbi:MAG: glycosyltransferase family 4 protein [Cyanobacteria bacterium J06554_1]
MNILFLHPNFPAQFRHLATILGADPNHQVAYITARAEGEIPGVQKFLYQTTRKVSPQTHRYVRPLEEAVCTGQAAWRTAHQMKTQLGFEPDVVYAHVGWGPGLFMKDLFPEARYVGFFEWYYHATGSDAGFDPADPMDDDAIAKLQLKNASILLELTRCDLGIVPTHWQKQQFPPEFHSKLHVLHDGIDLDVCYPQPNTKLVLPPRQIETNAAAVVVDEPSEHQGFGKSPKGRSKGKGKKKGKCQVVPVQQKKQKPKSTPLPMGTEGLDLSEANEIVTYVARGMEPYRGFPQFMAAVEKLQKMRPHCHVVIVGEDRVAYGKELKDGRTYREKALDELDLDLSRVHFTGRVSYNQLQQVYRASSVHVYLTYPFVLSWSMLEAMASGCVVLGSKTAPVEEVITDGENGFLVDFWDVDAIATQLNTLLDNSAQLAPIRQQARQTVVERYDLSQLLPQQIALLTDTSEKEKKQPDQWKPTLAA